MKNKYLTLSALNIFSLPHNLLHIIHINVRVHICLKFLHIVFLEAFYYFLQSSIC